MQCISITMKLLMQHNSIAVYSYRVTTQNILVCEHRVLNEWPLKSNDPGSQRHADHP